jgi:hypothetical protein
MDWSELFTVEVKGNRDFILGHLRHASAFAGGTDNYSWTWIPDGAVFGFRAEAARTAFRTWVGLRAAA